MKHATPASHRPLGTLLLTGALLTPAAWAHGPQGHAGQMPMAKHHDLVKEQKPWGIAAERSKARRTIEIRMTDDMRFTPERIEVREGETVRIVAANRGQVMHEIVLGTREELLAHAELMKKHPDMEHDEPHMAHVPAGKRGDIVWTFNRPGEFEFACLIAGHYEAGMKGRITVLPASGQRAQP
ncbi:cupredoxin domain-containing protein [Hydrogenophaga aquatica]